MGLVRHGSATATQAVRAEIRRSQASLAPLDDCLYALQPSIPHLTRSAPHRCLQRHGISHLQYVRSALLRSTV